MCTFCFCLFMLEKEKEKIRKKKQKNWCFLGGCEQRRCLLQKRHCLIGKHYLCSEGKKPRIFVATICFRKMVLFRAHSKSPNTTKIGVSAGTGENPKMAFLIAKVPRWEGASKGTLLSVIPSSCAPLKTLLFIVFSAKHSFAEKKSVTCKNKHLPNIGGSLATSKRSFFCLFFVV